MKPFITFTVEFKSRVSLNSLQQNMLNICPFDHLPRKITIIKKGYIYDIQVFFPDVEFLESVHSHLEIESKDMEDKLNNSYLCGKVTKIVIGVET